MLQAVNKIFRKITQKNKSVAWNTFFAQIATLLNIQKPHALSRDA